MSKCVLKANASVRTAGLKYQVFIQMISLVFRKKGQRERKTMKKMLNQKRYSLVFYQTTSIEKKERKRERENVVHRTDYGMINLKRESIFDLYKDDEVQALSLFPLCSITLLFTVRYLSITFVRL